VPDHEEKKYPDVTRDPDFVHSTDLGCTTSELLQSNFKPAKVFRDRIAEGKSFTSLSFDDKGEQVVTAGEDETIQLFSCKSGK